MRVDELEKEVNEKDREIKRMKTNYREKIVEIEEQLEVKSTEVETLKVTPLFVFYYNGEQRKFFAKGKFLLGEIIGEFAAKISPCGNYQIVVMSVSYRG